MEDYRDKLDELGLTEDEQARVQELLATVHEPDAAFVNKYGQVCKYRLSTVEEVRKLRERGVDAAMPYCVISGEHMVPVVGTVDCTW